MKYQVKFTGQFKKDLKLAGKQGKNLEVMFSVIEKIANEEELELKHRNHYLIGNYKGCLECHIESDWLLIYEVFEDEQVLVLNRTGSHAMLFK